MLDEIIIILNLKQGKAFQISPKEDKDYCSEGKEGMIENFLKIIKILNYAMSAVKWLFLRTSDKEGVNSNK